MSNFIRPIVIGLALSLGLGAMTACVAATPTQESTGQYLDSSGVTAKVKSQFVATKGLNSTDINVKTYKGVVMLSGFVNSDAQSQLAEEVASQVPGVQKVQNNLQVKTSN